MQHIPKPQEIYKHFKGNLYQIVTLAEHSETGEKLVIYQALYGEFKIYARPLANFMDKVDKEKYPQFVQEYRFEQLQQENDKSTEKDVNEEETGTGEAETEVNEAETEVSEAETEEADEILNIDPKVLEFLDASTYAERLNILAGLHHRITDDMINVMAVATDIEVKAGDVEERYTELRNCLLTLEKFECNRLR